MCFALKSTNIVPFCTVNHCSSIVLFLYHFLNWAKIAKKPYSMADCKANLKKSVPKYGIFGPTRSMKYSVDLKDLKPNSKGACVEFCTEELKEDFENLMRLEEKYFDGEDMMKSSYLLNDLANHSDEDDSMTMFEKLSLKMKNITEDGGVKGLTLSEGVGKVVTEGAHVRVHYHAFLEDMIEPFDSSYLQGKPLQLTLGQGNVIAGLDLGIVTMRKKEKKRFLVSPEYAYGAIGCPPRIPANSTILFEVELLSFLEGSILDEVTEDEKKLLSFQKMIEVAKAEKKEGIVLYEQNMYAKAMRKFMACINVMESVHLKDEADEAEMIKVICKAYQNMALCCLKLGNYGKALMSGRRVLEYDSKRAKALYIAGKSLRHIGDFKEARTYLLQARKFAPSSVDIVKELKILDKTELKYNENKVTMYKKMFNNSQTCGLKESSLVNTETNSGETSSSLSNFKTSSAFQQILRKKLNAFVDDKSSTTLAIPLTTFTQEEVYYAAVTAEDFGCHVDFIDKPGKPKQLKITKH